MLRHVKVAITGATLYIKTLFKYLNKIRRKKERETNNSRYKLLVVPVVDNSVCACVCECVRVLNSDACAYETVTVICIFLSCVHI